MRDLGGMGESAFNLWCKSVGLTANVAIIDKTGWDYIVEFPLEMDPDLPVDMISAPIECKVQVKSTDGNKRKLPIEVSNLIRLIRTQMPAFYCFIEFDGKNEAQRCFLVHVGKEIIEQTLQRIRELDENGEGNKLHKHKIVIHYGEGDRLAKPDGESLKKRIGYYVPEGIEKYIENKNRLLNTLGFEDGSYQINFKLFGEDKINDLVDMTLGISKNIEVHKFVGHRSRFGIVSEAPFIDSEKGKLEIQGVKPFTKVILTFKEYDFSPGISFDGNLYISPLSRDLPQKFLRLRVEGKFFELIFEPFNRLGKYNFFLNGQVKITLKELRDILKILTLLQSSPTGIILSMQQENLPPITSKISANVEIPDLSKAYDLAEKAACICRKLSIHEENITANANDLLNFSDSIDRFYSITNKPKIWMKTEFTVDEGDINIEKKAACVFLLNTVIGDHIVGCYIGVIGFLRIIGEKCYQLTSTESILGRSLIAKHNEEVKQEMLDREFGNFETQLEKKGLEIFRIGAPEPKSLVKDNSKRRVD